MALRHTLAALGLALVAIPAQAAAQGSSEEITRCMLERTQDDHRDAMRDFLVAALVEDKASYDAALGRFTNAMVSLATSCDVSIERFNEPAVQDAFNQYGIIMGERIMSAAMAKMSQL